MAPVAPVALVTRLVYQVPRAVGPNKTVILTNIAMLASVEQITGVVVMLDAPPLSAREPSSWVGANLKARSNWAVARSKTNVRLVRVKRSVEHDEAKT